MYPHAKDVDRAAVGVEARIYDVLEIAREPKRLSNVHAVKHIQAAFHGSLNGSVPDKTIHTAKRQVFRMNLRDPTQIDPNTGDVLGARPLSTLSQQSEGGGTIGRRV